MSTTAHVIAIIPARGGSKGIPGKNLRIVGGKPLIAHSIRHARSDARISAVYVSTDDPSISQAARAHGALVIDRPAALATDTATSESALLHALDTLAEQGAREPDAVVFLQATSPRRRDDDVTRALDAFFEHQADSLFSSTPAHGFMWRVGSDGPVSMNYDPTSRPRRQDAPRDVIENGSIYIFKPAVLRSYNSRLGGRIVTYEMRAEDSFQIDEPWELELLDRLLSREAAAGSTRATPTTQSHPRFEGASPTSGTLSPSDRAYFSRREPPVDVNYEDAYWGTVTDPDGVKRDRIAEREQHLADVATEIAFIRSLPTGRVLDVGCGLGFLLSGLPSDWDKHGVEVSAFAAEHARTHGTIHHGELADARYPDGHFDVVVLHHVIEHVDEPLALMREVLRVMKSGGRLVLGTPDFDGAMARRYGDRYRLLHDPTHVSLFTNESMHRFLRDLGLVIDRTHYPFFETRHFNRPGLERLFDTAQISPAFYGSFMTFYCTKPSDP